MKNYKIIIIFVMLEVIFANQYWSQETENYFSEQKTADTLRFYEGKIGKAGSDSIALAKIYFDLGMFCYNNYYIEPAIEIFQQAKNFTREKQDISNINFYIGSTYSTVGNYTEAFKYQKEALILAKDIQDKGYECQALGELAVLHYCVSNLDSAIAFFRQAISVAEQIPNIEKVSIYYNNIAIVFDEMGDYEKAWEYYDKSLQINLKRKDLKKIATCYNNMALVLENQGNYDTANEYYFQALKHAEMGGDSLTVAKYQTNRAYIYEIQELYDKALKIQKESFKVHEAYGLLPEMALNLEHMGRIYSKMDSTEQALSYWNKAIDINAETGNEKGVGIILVNIGNYETSIGNFYAAIENFQKALTILEKSGDRRNFAACNINLGNCYFERNSLQQAEKYTQIGFEQADEMGLMRMKSDASHILAKIFNKMHRYEEAFRFLEINKTLSDSLLNEEKVRDIAKKESQFKFEKVLLKRDAEEKRLKSELLYSKFERNVYILSTSIFCGIAIGLGFILKLIRDKNRKLFQKNVALLQSCQNCEHKTPTKDPKYSSSNLSENEEQRIKCRLAELMESEEIWRNSGLKINDIAEQLQTNSTYLSQIINSEYEQNFANFVNEYRIKEAQKLILKGYHENFTLEALAMDCGFKSRSTFYAAFKKFTGLTPTKFIAIKNENKSQYQKIG